MLAAALWLWPVSDTALAQPAGGAADNPLAPADTHSPRSTLRSFLFSSRAAVVTVRKGDDEVLGLRGRQASDALDSSATPYGETPSARFNRALMLREILDRYIISDLQEVPGRSQVAAPGLTHRTIPGST